MEGDGEWASWSIAVGLLNKGHEWCGESWQKSSSLVALDCNNRLDTPAKIILKGKQNAMFVRFIAVALMLCCFVAFAITIVTIVLLLVTHGAWGSWTLACVSLGVGLAFFAFGYVLWTKSKFI